MLYPIELLGRAGRMLTSPPGFVMPGQAKCAVPLLSETAG